jgi:hypothetical protein
MVSFSLSGYANCLVVLSVDLAFGFKCLVTIANNKAAQLDIWQLAARVILPVYFLPSGQ